MKKIGLLLLLLTLPSLSFAKYCPTCFQTFQVQTVRGRSKLLYRWMMTALNSKNPIKYEDLKLLFNPNVSITINGRHIARGLPAVYRYFIRIRQQQLLKESKLKVLLADGPHAAIEYQMITQRRGQKYRSLVIAIWDFKAHKLEHWSSVSHTSRIKN